MAEKQARRKDRGEAPTPADLEARVRELREEQFRLRFQFATRQLTNTARLREIRREIARAKTLQRQLELAGRSA